MNSGDIELGTKFSESRPPYQAIDSKKAAHAGRSLRFQEGGLKEATIVWKDLEKFVEVPGAVNKQILFSVSGAAKPGELIALMGPSGSGKTTLLNVLGGRALANMTGKVYLNGVAYKKSMKRTIAYVLQEDIFYTQLTVRQQLTFTSHLRLPDKLSDQKKSDAVENVIKMLRIEKCADTQIMLISGGEKKRCNIGTELLTNPSVLLLDEPTSGLDSTAANSLVLTMREMAEDRMTIISSIHQPSSKVFYSFDKLILLADGRIAYCGPPKNCLAYLATRNYVPPADYNPADFVMDLVTTTEAEDGSADGKSTRTILCELWDNTLTDREADAALGKVPSPYSTEEGGEVQQKEKDEEAKGGGGGYAGRASGGEVEDDSELEEGETADNLKYMASYSTQFKTLFRRNLIISQNVLMTQLTVIQAIAVAVICGLAWFRMPNTEDRIVDRSGFIFFFMTYWFFMTLFQGMMQFIPERSIIIKERSSGSYRLSAYFLTKIITELPIRLLLPFAFLAICYPMSGMNPDPRIFFAIVGTQLLAALCGESVGLFIGTSTMDFERAMVIATVVSLALMLVGGFFAQNLPPFVSWVRYLSPFKYSYDACLKLEFTRDVNCDGGDILTECVNNPAGKVDGSVVVDFLGATESVALNTGMLMVFTVFFRLLAYLALRFVPHNSGRA